MEEIGPPLELLTRRLAGTPSVFLSAPQTAYNDGLPVPAVVADLWQDLGGLPLSQQELRALVPRSETDVARARLQLVVCWLLHDCWFRDRRLEKQGLLPFLMDQLGELTKYTNADEVVADADRREEMSRLLLQSLQLRPAGETAAQAEDRLRTISSVERDRVIRAAQAAEERARAIREAMARKAAEEAAASYNRE